MRAMKGATVCTTCAGNSIPDWYRSTAPCWECQTGETRYSLNYGNNYYQYQCVCSQGFQFVSPQCVSSPSGMYKDWVGNKACLTCPVDLIYIHHMCLQTWIFRTESWAMYCMFWRNLQIKCRTHAGPASSSICRNRAHDGTLRRLT
jgi:hypothetical protein